MTYERICVPQPRSTAPPVASAISFCRFSSSICSSLALSSAIACLRFCICSRCVLETTMIPVGLCTMRTADATLLTFCPPGPLERAKVVSSISVSGMFSSTSSNSGVTSTVEKLVCRLPCALKGLTRASRCVPRSQLRYPKAKGPVTCKVTVEMPTSVPCCMATSSTFHSGWCCSKKRRYMRKSISHQSSASVPPSPEEMVKKQSRWSCLPDKSDWSSIFSMVDESAKSASSASAMRSLSPSSLPIS